MEQGKEFKHISVLFEETVDGLNVQPGGIYVDGTLGGAGHAKYVCERMQESGRFIGIDQDEDAIRAASERLKQFPFVTIVRSNYENMTSVLKEHGITKVNGIVLDLGVSSYQLDTADRGFTYKVDAPLDMRMDNRMEKTAKDIVNDYSEMELFRMIRDYGEDQFAKNIAKHIVRTLPSKNTLTCSPEHSLRMMSRFLQPESFCSRTTKAVSTVKSASFSARTAKYALYSDNR